VLNGVLKKALGAARRAAPSQHQGRSAGIVRRSVQTAAAACAEHPVLAILATVSDCARATPKDTAVAATISEMASASVAINSTPRVRFFDNAFSEMGDAKPTFPVSVVMARLSFANQFAVLS
jgi:hypothetical protein